MELPKGSEYKYSLDASNVVSLPDRPIMEGIEINVPADGPVGPAVTAGGPEPLGRGPGFGWVGTGLIGLGAVGALGIAWTLRGRMTEEAIRLAFRLPLGHLVRVAGLGSAIPDSETLSQVIEIKDRYYVYNSRQLRVEIAHAVGTNKEFVLIVTDRTWWISEPLQNQIRGAGGRILCYTEMTVNGSVWGVLTPWTPSA